MVSKLTLLAMDNAGFCEAGAEERVEDDPHSIWASAEGAAPAETSGEKQSAG